MGTLNYAIILFHFSRRHVPCRRYQQGTLTPTQVLDFPVPIKYDLLREMPQALFPMLFVVTSSRSQLGSLLYKLGLVI